MTFTLRKVGPGVALGCEILGLLALALTPDVEKSLFIAPLVMGALSWLAGFSLKDRLLLLLITLLVLVGYSTSAGAPTGTLMARALIPAHALLWLASEEHAYRFWRLGVALMEIVLASILAPEVHMFLFIFAFVVFGSLSLSLGFLERGFRTRDPDSLGRPLRLSYVGSVLLLSCVIFLSSLVIFPLLPRSQWASSGSGTNAGYNDVVSFQQGILYWAQQDSRPALWIFRSSGKPWESIVPYFLLRGQPLEQFNGHEWRVRTIPSASTGDAIPKTEDTLEILRQPLPTDALPVPYGALRVSTPAETAAVRYGGGEWMSVGSRYRSVKYGVDIGGFSPALLGPGSSPDNISIDEKLFPRTVELSRRLVEGAVTSDDKIRRVERFFREGGFEYELAPMEVAKKGAAHPVEKFLFETKKGHCELFSSAAALLFRAAGIPARLVVGFRVRPPSRGDVLTVRSSDAHAWVEVWRSGRGWSPVDPTPVLSEPGWLRETAGEAYDWVGAYWHRYILEYEFDTGSILPKLLSLSGVISGGMLAVGLALLWNRRRRKVPPRERLNQLMFRLEDDLLHRAGLYPDQAFRLIKEARDWKEDYMTLRFGPKEPTEEDLRAMDSRARWIVLGAGLEPRSAA